MKHLLIILLVICSISLQDTKAQKTIIPNFYVENLHTALHEVIIYPNPVEGSVVNFKSPAVIKKIEISNLIGKCIKTALNENNIFDDMSLVLEKCESGIYLAKITFEDDKVLVKKLLVK